MDFPQNPRWHVWIALFLGICALAQAGCGKFSVSYNSGSTVRKEWKSNGHWTISERKGAVTRELDASADMEVANGQVTRFPKGALIKVALLGDGPDRRAEFRENGGALELWVKDGDQWRVGTPEDQDWVSACLRELTSNTDKQAAASNELMPAGKVLEALEDQSLRTGRKDILEKLLERKSLSPAEQTALVDSASRLQNFSSETKEVLLKLIARSDFSPEARPAVLRAVDKLSFDSEKVAVQRALLEKKDANP
jgi:hypothetical protein